MREKLYEYLQPVRERIEHIAECMGVELTNLHIQFPAPIEIYASYPDRVQEYRIWWNAMYKGKYIGARFGSDEFPTLEKVLSVISIATIAILESYSGKVYPPDC